MKYCVINQILTPNNLPVVIDIENVLLSPYFRFGQVPDIEFYDFTLEIPEGGDENSNENNILPNSQIEENQNSAQSSHVEEVSHRYRSHQSQEIIITDAPPSQFNISSFTQIYKELKDSHATDTQLKGFIADYLTEEDFEEVDFENCLVSELAERAMKNLRPIGPISWLQRKYKVQKYTQKKKSRTWRKKISYDCRKRVADQRLRVKGKFVTKKQICTMLGVNQVNQEEIKDLFEPKKRDIGS